MDTKDYLNILLSPMPEQRIFMKLRDDGTIYDNSYEYILWKIKKYKKRNPKIYHNIHDSVMALCKEYSKAISEMTKWENQDNEKVQLAKKRQEGIEEAFRTIARIVEKM